MAYRPSRLTDMISKDIKAVAMNRLNDGMPTAQIAKFLGISQRIVQLWRQQRPKQRHTICSRPARRKLSAEQEQSVLTLIAERPGLCLDQIVNHILRPKV